jgi:predicted phosphoadenosine phosphosulfate sulfurtransferase
LDILYKYNLEELEIAFTGGKDSTLLLHLISEVCQENEVGIPNCFCIDEGDMFEEVKDFIEKISKNTVFYAGGYLLMDDRLPNL